MFKAFSLQALSEKKPGASLVLSVCLPGSSPKTKHQRGGPKSTEAASLPSLRTLAEWFASCLDRLGTPALHERGRGLPAMEDGLMDEGDAQFDFDGASNGAAGESAAGFGAGWEDDLETMLLVGMKKKAQRRLLLMGALALGGLAFGMVLGIGLGSGTAEPVIVTTGGGGAGCVGAACKGCSALHGASFPGWQVQCSGGHNIDCDGCESGLAGDVSTTQRDLCPHGCICTAECKHTNTQPFMLNPLVVGVDGGDGLYAVNCNDGAWDGEPECSPANQGTSRCIAHTGDSIPLTTTGGHDNQALCVDNDDCVLADGSNPCLHGGECHDAFKNYTCTCLAGFNGAHCETDIDECKWGFSRDSPPSTVYPAIGTDPCSLASPPGGFGSGYRRYGTVKCIESGGSITIGPSPPSHPTVAGPDIHAPFEQPPPGYAQYNAAEGLFLDGPNTARFVCVCSSTNETAAGYAGMGAYDTRTSFGDTCNSGSDSCANSPCQNGGACVNQAQGYECTCPGGYVGLTCEEVEHTVRPPPMAGGTITAVAAFNQDGVHGSITMTQDAANSTAPTTVVVNLRGLADGPNPWHVHSKPVGIPGNCNSTSTGGHYLQTDTDHSDIWDLGAAMSLLGAEASMNAVPGETNMSAIDLTLPLSGDFSVVGKSIVIHKKNNDRWVCATITQQGGGATDGFTASCGTMESHFAGVWDQYQAHGDCDGAVGDECHVRCVDGYVGDGSTDYFCAASGWQDDGKAGLSLHCVDRDECASTPCQNDAACATPFLDAYVCSCAAGFLGDNCDATVDNCDPDGDGHSVCQHDAVCSITADSYTCACTTGFEGNDCETDTDECADTPCQNGATCSDSNTDKHGVQPGEFACACAVGWNGHICDSSVDFQALNCEPAPCQNAGVCTGDASGYACACADGYEGDNCQTDTDECHPNGADGDTPCQNGGTCTTAGMVAAFVCTCTGGFDGEVCDSTSDACASAPCQNGSQCATVAQQFQCTCTAGFAGETCTDADPCTPGPCHNGGACSSDDNGAAACDCTTATGWSGDHCESDTDDCSSTPCLNGGACTDGADSYTCACDATHSGDNCDATVDPCAAFDCSGHGTCAADGGTPSCTCTAGWHGDHCAGNVDECAPAPCLNDGVCSDGDNSFTCACVGAYIGAACDTACGDGQRPNADGSACEGCPVRTAGTGGTCNACTAGKKVGPASTACVDCAGAEAGTDGTCTACGAGQHPAAGHDSCMPCEAGKTRAADSTDATCTVCGAGETPDAASTTCVACGLGKATTTAGVCGSCDAGKEGAGATVGAGHADRCTTCGAGTYSDDGTGCVACPANQAPNAGMTACVDASTVGESGTCDLTGGQHCLVLRDLALTAPIHGKNAHTSYISDGEDDLEQNFVYDCDGSVVPACDSTDVQDLIGGNTLVIAPIAKGDASTVTIEFGTTSADECAALLALFTAELADPTSVLMAGPLSLDPAAAVDSHCIDGGRRR